MALAPAARDLESCGHPRGSDLPAELRGSPALSPWSGGEGGTEAQGRLWTQTGTEAFLEGSGSELLPQFLHRQKLRPRASKAQTELSRLPRAAVI